jgi:hypothetical protein
MEVAMKRVTTPQAIETFFADRSPGAMVSLADAITYVQLVNPDCELTDDEIGSLIGWHAARRLCNLKFDLRERSPSMHKGWRSFNDGTPTAH